MACRKFIVLLLLAQVFVSHRSSAQVAGLDYRNNARVHPLKLIDLWNPGLEISIERRLQKHFSLQVSGTAMPGVLPSLFKSVSGYRLLMSPKFFFNPDAKVAQLYVAPEAGWGEVNLRTSREMYNPDDTSASGALQNVLKDDYRVYKRLQFYHLLAGVQMRVSRLLLDASMGIGVRVRTAIHFDQDDLPGFRARPQQASPVNGVAALREGRAEVWPNVPLTFSIGYRF